MIRINLLPLKEAERAATRRLELSIAILSLVFTLLVMISLHLWQGGRLAKTETEMKSIEGQISVLTGTMHTVAELAKKKKELQAKLDVIHQLSQRKSGPVHLLLHLSESTPEKLWLTEFNETGGTVTLSGLALDNQTIAEFMRQLSRAPVLTNVDLVETTQKEEGGVKLRKFIVKAQANYYGRGKVEDKKPEVSEGSR